MLRSSTLADSPTQPESAIAVDFFEPDLERVNRCLADIFVEDRRTYATSPLLEPLLDQLTEFVLHGGKRLRPRLCLASYRINSGRVDIPPNTVLRAAAALELFHAFMLVHDDLIDGSVLRRGRPTLPEALRLGSSDPDSPIAGKRSTDLGLLAGDLLCAMGHRLLSRCGLDDATLGRTTRLVSDMLMETGLGEALDVLSDDCPLALMTEGPLIEAYLRKTARYTVSGPMVMGATIAGASSRVCQALERFGDLLGFGYQVQNDLASLAEDPRHGDHADLDGGKRTYVLWAAFQGLNSVSQRELLDALATPASIERRYRLLDLIHSSRAIEHCRARLEIVQRDAIAALKSSTLTHAQRSGFIALVELFRLSSTPTAKPRVHAET